MGQRPRLAAVPIVGGTVYAAEENGSERRGGRPDD
jgi:hypothetical protein